MLPCCKEILEASSSDHIVIKVQVNPTWIRRSELKTTNKRHAAVQQLTTTFVFSMFLYTL